jgi:hypothetical protein
VRLLERAATPGATDPAGPGPTRAERRAGSAPADPN